MARDHLHSDDEIYEIAREIRRAVHANPRDHGDLEILSVRQELPPGEEDRVERALGVLQLIHEVSRYPGST
jgi:hypothetical protein